MMKQKEMMKKVREMGLTINKKSSGEFRINFKDGKEATAYYTQDREDAYMTAVAMASGGYSPDKGDIHDNA